MSPKQLAAEAALKLIQHDMVVGLGTGSTAEVFIDALGAALRAGRLRGIRAVPTSNRSLEQAQRLGIPIVSLAEVQQIDIDVDGADEIDPQLNLIKGMGGALLREKIVAQNSMRMIVIADSSKLVQVLGVGCALPVEVAAFEHAAHERYLRQLGCEPVLRRQDGKPVMTDNGNVIYDCRFTAIEDPLGLQAALRERAGVIDSGLFLGLASMAFVADASGDVRTLHRAQAM